MNKKKPNIGVVTWPILEAGVISLRGLARVLYPLSNELYIVSGGAACHVFVTARPRVHLYLVEQKSTANAFVRVINNICVQVKVSWRLAKIARHVDFWIFLFGGPVLSLPMLTAKLFRKHVILNFTGSDIEDARIQIGGLISKVVSLLTEIDCQLSSRIIVYSERLIKDWHLEKYRHKISIANEYFLDFNKFMIQKQLGERDNLVGYIGRLSPEKGILNFIKAVPEVLKQRDEIKFLVGGDGQLRDKIEKYLDSENLTGKVKLVGWIPHDELPNYLNELKLIVLPSYTEGLPGIMLEAMACGTPVLVTPVGAIPDMIKQGETGFIMENNSPKSIARDILGAMGYPELSRIAQNARKLAEQEYTYEVTVALYKAALEELMKSKKQCAPE